jgi:hypothetical protein
MTTAGERIILTESKESLLGRYCQTKLGPVGLAQYMRYAAEYNIPVDGIDVNHSTVQLSLGQLLEIFSGYFEYEGLFVRDRIYLSQGDEEPIKITPDTELMATLSPKGDSAIRSRLYGINPYSKGWTLDVSMSLSKVGDLLGRVPDAFDSDITIAADTQR